MGRKGLASLAAIGLAVVAISGCTLTRGSSVVVGQKRDAIDPASVKIYVQPPKKYEQIAILSADARNAFASQQNLTDNTIERLKKEAAELGANGILLSGISNVQQGSSGVAYVNPGSPIVTGSSNAIMGKEGQGMAIYVIEE